MAKNTTQFTNRPDVYLDEETGGPENWGRIPMEGEAPETLPNFAPGATENQIYPSETPEAPHAGPQVYEKDPRLGMNPQGDVNNIEAQAPLVEIQRYAIDLKSMTQGRATYTMEFDHYEEVPAQITQKIIALKQAEKAEKA